MTDIHVRPDLVEQGTRETLPWRFDTTALLGPGETLTLPTSTLTNLTTGALYPAGLSGSPAITDVYISQIVTALAAGVTYRLSVGFTTAPTGAKFEMALDILCPF